MLEASRMGGEVVMRGMLGYDVFSTSRKIQTMKKTMKKMKM